MATSQPADTSGPVFTVITAMTAIGLTVALWQDGQGHIPFAWLAAMLLAALADFALWRRHMKANPGKRLQISLLMIKALLAILWCVPVALFFTRLQPSTQLVFVSFLFVSALAATVVQHREPLIHLLCAGMALPLCAILLWRPDSDVALLSSGAILSGWLGVLALGWSLHHAYSDRSRLREERADLLENISRAMAELDRLHLDEQLAREEADRANREKSRFLAHVSHDLRQPVHAANLLLETLPGEIMTGKAGKIMNQIRRSIGNLTELFDALLDTAMLETGQIAVTKQGFLLNGLFAGLADDCEELAAKRGIVLRLHASAYAVDSDPIILSRMIRNLVMNAIHHSDGTAILVGPRRSANGLCIEVRDNGKGISNADQAVIFREFTRLDGNAASSGGKNVGLGLSIVQRLCRVLGYGLSVRSAPGKGSTFSLEGLDHALMPVMDQPAKQPQPLDEKTFRIALFDDDETVLASTSDLLTKWGFTVDTSATGEIADKGKPDFILADYDMPGINGVTIIRALREKWQSEIPALIITGSHDAGVAAQVAAEGLPLLRKPIRPVTLKSAILADIARSAG